MKYGLWLVVAVAIVVGSVWGWSGHTEAVLDRELDALWEIDDPGEAFSSTVDFLNRHEGLDEHRVGDAVMILANTAFEAGEIDGLVSVLDSLRSTPLPHAAISRMGAELHDALVMQTVMSPTGGDVEKANETARELLEVQDLGAAAYRMMASLRANILDSSAETSNHWLTVRLAWRGVDATNEDDSPFSRALALDGPHHALLSRVVWKRGLNAALAVADSLTSANPDPTLAAVLNASRYRLTVDSNAEFALAAAHDFALAGNAIDDWYIPSKIGSDIRDRELDFELALDLAEWALVLAPSRRGSSYAYSSIGWTHYRMDNNADARANLEASVAHLESAPTLDDTSVQRLLTVYETTAADEAAIDLLATIAARSVLPNEEVRQKLAGLFERTGRTDATLSEVIASHRYAGVEQAPDFTVQRASGETMHLADLRGSIILLNFWSYG
ncbi:peroxiredoxin family protein [bacterium]|nr:peroxiredoxin family protein [bacterium]